MVDFFPALWAAPSPRGGFDFLGLAPLFLVFGLMYFFLIRPQQKKDQQHKKFLASLRVGDAVVAQSGIVGEVSSLPEGDLAILRISPDTQVCFRKAFLSGPWSGNLKQVFKKIEKKAKA